MDVRLWEETQSERIGWLVSNCILCGKWIGYRPMGTINEKVKDKTSFFKKKKDYE
jgi:hypothetical protein